MAGRPRNSLQIVDAFLQPYEIIAIVPDLITLGGELNNKLSILQYLRREGYLQTVLIAPIATSFAPFVSAVPKTAIDGDVIGTQSVRQSSFFEGSKVRWTQL